MEKVCALLGGHGGVALDEGCHDTARGLDTKRQRGHIEQEEVLQLFGLVSTRENGGLHGGTVGYGLIGVDGLVELLAVEVLGQQLLHLGDAGGSAHQHDLVYLALRQLGITKNLLDRLHALAEVVHAQILEACTGNNTVVVEAIVQGVDLDVSLSGARQGALRALASSAKATQGALVIADVLLCLALELLREVVDHAVIEVLASKVSVTGGGLHLEDALFDGEQRHIEGSTSKIEDKHVLLSTLLVKAVGNGGGSGLVDNAKYIEARNLSSVLRGSALHVVEVGRHGDYGILDLTAKIGLSDLLHLQKHHGRDLLGLEVLGLTLKGHIDDGLAVSVRLDSERPVLDIRLDLWRVKFASNKALGIEHSVRAVHGGLVLGGISNETLSVVESHVRGGCALAHVVGDDLDTIILPHTYARVGGSEIDSDLNMERSIGRISEFASVRERKEDE